MVADALRGPYEPPDGTGLVAANPAIRPYQSYSWLVANDLRVSSFVDMLDGSNARRFVEEEERVQ